MENQNTSSEGKGGKITDILTSLQSLHIFKNLEHDEILEILKISQIKKIFSSTDYFFVKVMMKKVPYM
jgi:hypothetical protein